jgi:GNAT superfamily N-acetyltransferase
VDNVDRVEGSLGVFAIRPAQPGDAEAIGEVFLEAAVAAWSSFLGEELVGSVQPRVHEWLRGAMLVAQEGDAIVGFTRIHPDEDEDGLGVLAMLYTRPSVWGRGAGRALMDAALGALRTQGSREAVLWTEERNVRARHVDEAGGWHLDGGVQEREWYGAPLRELRYRRSLDGAA